MTTYEHPTNYTNSQLAINLAWCYYTASIRNGSKKTRINGQLAITSTKNPGAVVAFGTLLGMAWAKVKADRVAAERLVVVEHKATGKYSERVPQFVNGYRIVKSTQKAHCIQVGAGLYWMPKSALAVRDGMAMAYGSARQMLARKVAEAHGCDANHTYVLDLLG